MIRTYLVRSVLVLGMAASAAACSSPREEMSRSLVTPTEQFPFKVEQHPDETLLAVHAGGVSMNQASALAGVTARWRESGGDAIVVRTPAGGPSERAAGIMADQVRSILTGAGTPETLVRVERYDAAGDPAAPLVVGFSRFEAEIPTCGGNWDNLTGTQSNSVHSQFGCSISANMAAQVANPRDLVQARAEDPTDASRRTFQTDLYRRGESTASKGVVVGGTVSQAVQ